MENIIITSKDAYSKLSELQTSCVLQIQQFIGDIPNKIKFEENGFEDLSGNDIEGVDKENVYFNNFEDSYPLHQLDLIDAIRIITIFEETLKH